MTIGKRDKKKARTLKEDPDQLIKRTKSATCDWLPKTARRLS